MKCLELHKDLWGTKYFCESGLKWNFRYVCAVVDYRTRQTDRQTQTSILTDGQPAIPDLDHNMSNFSFTLSFTVDPVDSSWDSGPAHPASCYTRQSSNFIFQTGNRRKGIATDDTNPLGQDKELIIPRVGILRHAAMTQTSITLWSFWTNSKVMFWSSHQRTAAKESVDFLGCHSALADILYKGKRCPT